MAGFKRVLLVLLIFLGPGSIIYFIARTVENKFIIPPYLGYSYTEDAQGKVIDSTAYNIPDFELTRFNGDKITRDSIKDKFIVLTTIQNDCYDLKTCGLGIYMFNEIFFKKLVKNKKSYHNVRVISILTDENGNPVEEGPSEILIDQMKEYDPEFWWLTYGDPTPFYDFPYYGMNFMLQPSTPKLGEIGKYAYPNSLVLIDDEGFIRGVTGAKRDSDIRNFFDVLKLLKKVEFDENRGK